VQNETYLSRHSRLGGGVGEREIQYEVFDCSRKGTKVRITREILIHRNPTTGEIDRKVTTSIDCDHKGECGVSAGSGSTIVVNWTECVHPDLKG
jgi:hypothetical protein